jgi:5-methylcytosine-specific restriction endonuclease McrA
MKNEIDIENPESIKFGLLNLESLNNKAIRESEMHFKLCCPYCENDLYAGNDRQPPEIDHFIPINKGGQHHPWNLLRICFDCNRKKKAKMPSEFLKKERYIECKDYLNKVLYKCTNQHEDKLQIASQVDYFIKQHTENKINDKDLIDNLYIILGHEIKPEEMPIKQLPNQEEDSTPFTQINHFWDALNLETRPKGYSNVKFYTKNTSTKWVYISLEKSYPIYVDYCNQNNIAAEPKAYIRTLFTSNDYKPFIKSTQKSRGVAWTKAGLGSCYCFRYYPQSATDSNSNTIIIGNKLITL